MTNINDTLKERGTTHGDFRENSLISQGIKMHIRTKFGVGELSIIQKEALDMIAHKIGRIVCGNADFKDHWVDIAGYATLVADTLEDNE